MIDFLKLLLKVLGFVAGGITTLVFAGLAISSFASGSGSMGLIFIILLVLSVSVLIAAAIWAMDTY